MTAKLILFVRRRPDLTPEQFKDRYETGHVPLAHSVSPLLRKYVRNYLSQFPGGPEPEYDAVSEFWFDNMADLEATVGWAASEEGQVLARDEAEFIDRDSMRLFIAEECNLADDTLV
ncbi:MAG: EthD domain-containing protein [Actinomycetota bacterium]|nr:EthD domain-containing protein [Actinomycetota bacterium]